MWTSDFHGVNNIHVEEVVASRGLYVPLKLSVAMRSGGLLYERNDEKFNRV